MGSALVIPEADEKISKATKTFRLTQKEISDLFMLFIKFDKQKIGLVSLDDIFDSCELHRNDFTDSICEALDIMFDDEGQINFSDFLTLVMSYCMFEPPEILKLLFYTYDQDKEGFIDAVELKRAMNTLHEIEAPDTVEGSVKNAWKHLEFADDGKIDFKEFKHMSLQFPAILEPAFKVQNYMIMNLLGQTWWDKKKRKVQEEKDEAERLWKKEQAKKLAKQKRKETRHIRKKMGLIRFYCCPCLRYLYDDTKERLTDEERAERERLIALARRKAELEAKNPNTTVAKKFEKKANADKNLVPERIFKSEREREERVVGRRERREKRKTNKDLQELKVNF